MSLFKLSALMIRRVTQRRVPRFAILFAVLFALLSAAQYWLLRQAVFGSVNHQLKEWAEQAVDLIAYKDHWDLQEYRQSADILAPSSYVVADNGTIIEARGFIPGFLKKAKLPPMELSLFDEPVTFKSDINDQWMLYARKLSGGTVVMGILSSEQVGNPVKLLKETAAKFGTALADALKVRSGDTPTSVDYAVFDDENNFLLSADFIPLKTEAASINRLTEEPQPVLLNGKPYWVYSRSILDAKGKAVGTILLPKNVIAEVTVIHEQGVINVAMTAGVWLVMVGILAVYFKHEEIRQRPRATGIEDAIAKKECQTIEFKEGQADKKLTEAICAFANTNSGTIFLGINDDAEVVGLKCIAPKERDDELMRVRQIASDKIKPSLLIYPEFLEHDGKLIMRIFVPRGDKVLYSVEGVQFVRDHNSSRKAQPEDLGRITKGYYS